jgi:hypothetical protein
MSEIATTAACSSAQLQTPGRRLARAGAYLQLGPLIGAAATIVRVIQAFNVLAADKISDPRELSGKVAGALLCFWGGLAVGLIGLFLVGTSLLTSRYRARWIFWLLVAYGVLFLCALNIGSLIGVAILVYCLTHRRDLLNGKAPSTNQSDEP